MFWYTHLYLDRKCMRHNHRLKYKIEHGAAHKGVDLMHLPDRAGAVLELIPSILLRQSRYPREQLCIIGMAGDRAGALELIRQIVDEVYREQHNFGMACYLQFDRKNMSDEGTGR